MHITNVLPVFRDKQSWPIYKLNTSMIAKTLSDPTRRVPFGVNYSQRVISTRDLKVCQPPAIRIVRVTCYV